MRMTVTEILRRSCDIRVCKQQVIEAIEMTSNSLKISLWILELKIYDSRRQIHDTRKRRRCGD